MYWEKYPPKLSFEGESQRPKKNNQDAETMKSSPCTVLTVTTAETASLILKTEKRKQNVDNMLKKSKWGFHFQQEYLILY